MHKVRIARLYLVIGLVVIALAVIVRPGVYNSLVNVNGSISTGDICSTLNIRSRTEWQWYWVEPRNYAYETASMELDTVGDHHTNHKLSLDLKAGTWREGGETGRLDFDGLRVLIDPNAPLTPEYRERIQGVRDMLTEIGTGTFFRPRHHSYSLKPPLVGMCLHGSGGLNGGLFLCWGWLLIWPVILILTRRGHGSRSFSPLKVYFLVGGGLAVWSALAAAVPVFSRSLGTTMMSAVTIVFLAGEIIIGYPFHGGSDALIVLATGVMMWATFVSLIVLWRIESKEHTCNASEADVGETKRWDDDLPFGSS